MNTGESLNEKGDKLADKANDLYKEGKEATQQAYKQGKEEAHNLYQSAKETASDLYEDGKMKLHDAQDSLHDYSDQMIKAVKEKPLTSLLIAGGIGFVLAALLKK